MYILVFLYIYFLYDLYRISTIVLFVILTKVYIFKKKKKNGDKD